MKYISSDTNVWIDFKVIKRLYLPFRLPFTYLMNKDAIDDELLSPKGMKEELLGFGLEPTEMSLDELYYGLEIASAHSKLSKYDCAALAIAKFRGLILLTGDAALRKVAEKENVKVIGTIGILDKLLEEKRIKCDEYIECINLLIEANGREVRLPINELKSRLSMQKE